MGGPARIPTQAARPGKAERIELRLSSETRILIEDAADLSGMSLSDFLVSRAQAAARDLVCEHERWVLTRHQSEAFLKALVDPPPPNDALKRAAGRHGSQGCNDA